MMRRILLTALAVVLLQACGTTTGEGSDPLAGLPVRKPCNLERLYEGMERGDILPDTPDMLFAKALSAGNGNVQDIRAYLRKNTEKSEKPGWILHQKNVR